MDIRYNELASITGCEILRTYATVVSIVGVDVYRQIVIGYYSNNGIWSSLNKVHVHARASS